MNLTHILEENNLTMGHRIKTTHEQILDYWNDNLHLIENLFLDIDNDTSQRLKKI